MKQIDIDRIKQNTTQMIAMEMYRKDNKMKRNKKVKLMLVALLCILSLGAIKTVDALSGGEISKRVAVFLTGENDQKIELEGDTYVDENGDTWIKCEKENSKIEVNESELERNEMEMEVQQSDDGIETTIK